MKRYEKLSLIVLSVLLAASLGAVLFTRSWGNYRDQVRALRKATTRSQAEDLVDTRPLDTAQQVASLAVTSTEQEYSADALRLGDRSVDLAFAVAVRDAAANPPPLTPQTRELSARIKADEATVAADQNRIAQFTQALAKAPPGAKDDLQNLIVAAQGQLALDQDDLDAAKQELVLAGGDKQAQIQQLLDQHNASDTHTAAAVSAASAAAAASIERTQSKSIVAQIRALNSLRSKKLTLAEAQKDAESLATRLSASRAELQKQLSEDRLQKRASRPAAAPAGPASAEANAPSPEPSAAAVLHDLGEAQKNVADLGQQIEVERQLAAVYGNWITFVGVREKAFLHGILVSIFWTLLIASCIFVANSFVQRFFAEVDPERRQLRTISAVLLFALQALGVLLILLVIFGVPGDLATVLALAGAGLTVALKDFIVGFMGWFVLMGKDGIRIGDWVEINGVGGEVQKIGPLHTVILETGNWTDSGHPTGRKVSFVNSFAIEGHYFNFSTSGQWLWDEIEVQVPESAEPYPMAEAIQKIAADETTKNAQLAEAEWSRVARAHGGRSFSAAPSLSVRPVASGVTVVLRYITRANERYEVRARLYRAIVELLQKKRVYGSTVSAPSAPVTADRA